MDSVGGLQSAKVGQCQHHINSIGQLSASGNRLLNVNISISRTVIVCQQCSRRLEVRNEEVTVGGY